MSNATGANAPPNIFVNPKYAPLIDLLSDEELGRLYRNLNRYCHHKPLVALGGEAKMLFTIIVSEMEEYAASCDRGGRIRERSMDTKEARQHSQEREGISK